MTTSTVPEGDEYRESERRRMTRVSVVIAATAQKVDRAL
jgi:hypothetical protein